MINRKLPIFNYLKFKQALAFKISFAHLNYLINGSVKQSK